MCNGKGQAKTTLGCDGEEDSRHRGFDKCELDVDKVSIISLRDMVKDSTSARCKPAEVRYHGV